MSALTTGLLVIGGMALFVVCSALLNGFALSVIWGWFMPGIFGLPELRLVEAIGVALIVSYLTHQYSDATTKHDGAEAMGYMIAHAVLKPLFAIGVAWCIKSFL